MCGVYWVYTTSLLAPRLLDTWQLVTSLFSSSWHNVRFWQFFSDFKNVSFFDSIIFSSSPLLGPLQQSWKLSDAREIFLVKSKTVFKPGRPCHNKFEDLPPEFLKTEQREREKRIGTHFKEKKVMILNFAPFKPSDCSNIKNILVCGILHMYYQD